MTNEEKILAAAKLFIEAKEKEGIPYLPGARNLVFTFTVEGEKYSIAYDQQEKKWTKVTYYVTEKKEIEL